MPDYSTIVGSVVLSAALSLIVSISSVEYRFRREQKMQADTDLWEWYREAEDLVKQVEYAFIYSLSSDRNSLNRASDELDPIIKPLHVHGHTAPDSVPRPLIQKMDGLATTCDEIVGITDSGLYYQNLDSESARDFLIDRTSSAGDFEFGSISNEEEWNSTKESLVHHIMEENLNSVNELLTDIRDLQ